MPCDVVDSEPRPHQVQLVTAIARDRLMFTIIERRSTLGLVCCEGALAGSSGALIIWMLLAPTSVPAPQQRYSISHWWERQEQSSAQAKVDMEVLRDEEILTIVVRQNPFRQFLSKHTFTTFPGG